VTAQQARLVDSGWFMGTRSRVSGKLAGSSESHPELHSSGGALGDGPKATIDRGLSTVLGRRGGPVDSATTLRAQSLLGGAATAVYTARSPAGRLHTCAAVPGSRISFMQPASGLFDVAHTWCVSNAEATKPIPVEAVAQAQYHYTGSPAGMRAEVRPALRRAGGCHRLDTSCTRGGVTGSGGGD